MAKPMKAVKPKKPAKDEKPEPLTELEQLRAEVLKLTDECAGLREKDRREKQAASEVRSCEADVEACKAELAAAKQRHADANKRLAAIVWGDAQQSHPELTPVEQAAAEAPPKRFDLAIDQVIEIDEDPATIAGLVVKAIVQGDKPTKIGKERIHEFMGLPYLVRQGWPEENPHRFFLQRLNSKDEWQQLYEAEFGRSVDGFDQSDDARHQRQTGGDDCGRVIAVGQKKYVLAPERHGLVLLCPAPVTVEEPTKPTGKDAAAGTEPEELIPDDIDAPPSDDADD